MSRIRLMTTAGGTVLSALAIGFFMQTGASVPPGRSALQPAPMLQAVTAPTATAAPDSGDDLALDLTAVSLTSAQPEIRAPVPMPVPALEDSQSVTRPEAAEGAPVDTAPDCMIRASATATPMASVNLVIDAPCHANERITIHHSGMMFTETTDAAGQLAVTVPALTEKAVFIAAFGNGKGAVAATRVPDVARIDRVALQWRGDAGFELHAREFGADYGDPGHVWSGAAPRPAGAGGLMLRLGDPATLEPQLVEVYSFPADLSDRAGTVLLSVEAEVTERNCGRDISAQSLEIRASGGLRTRDLDLSMPNCSALGDFLVLNNLMDNLKIAAR